MTTFADIVADALPPMTRFLGPLPPEPLTDVQVVAAAILADPRLAELLAGALHECVAAVEDEFIVSDDDADYIDFQEVEKFAAAIIRSLGETK